MLITDHMYYLAYGNIQHFVCRGLSLLASWAWGMDGSMDNSKLQEAIWTEDCQKRYPQSSDKACEIFDWQSSLNIDHVEL